MHNNNTQAEEEVAKVGAADRCVCVVFFVVAPQPPTQPHWPELPPHGFLLIGVSVAS